MAVKNRTCVCCGARYEYCPSCSEFSTYPAWMIEFCSESCKDLWDTATQFNLKQISKEEAQEMLSTLDLKPVSEYTRMLQKDIEHIRAKSSNNNKHEVVKTNHKAQ